MLFTTSDPTRSPGLSTRSPDANDTRAFPWPIESTRAPLSGPASFASRLRSHAPGTAMGFGVVSGGRGEGAPIVIAEPDEPPPPLTVAMRSGSDGEGEG